MSAAAAASAREPSARAEGTAAAALATPNGPRPSSQGAVGAVGAVGALSSSRAAVHTHPHGTNINNNNINSNAGAVVAAPPADAYGGCGEHHQLVLAGLPEVWGGCAGSVTMLLERLSAVPGQRSAAAALLRRADRALRHAAVPASRRQMVEMAARCAHNNKCGNHCLQSCQCKEYLRVCTHTRIYCTHALVSVQRQLTYLPV
jgi:hypothetical protein